MTMLVMKIIRNLDFFSHDVKFNINRNGSSHGTSFGGVVSIFLAVVYFIYSYSLVEKMLTHGETSSYMRPVKLDDTIYESNDIDIITYNNINIFNKDSGYNEPLFYTNETRRYIKMEYQERETDWSMSDKVNFNGSMHRSTYIPAVQCNENSFRVKNKKMNFYEAWDGYSIICP